MVVISLLLFLIPAGFSLKVKEEYFGEEKKLKNLILTYIKYVLFINLMAFLVINLYFNGELYVLSNCLESLSFILKYMLLSTVFAVVVPIVDEYLKKNIQFKLKLKTSEKKNEKKNK